MKLNHWKFKFQSGTPWSADRWVRKIFNKKLVLTIHYKTNCLTTAFEGQNTGIYKKSGFQQVSHCPGLVFPHSEPNCLQIIYCQIQENYPFRENLDLDWVNFFLQVIFQIIPFQMKVMNDVFSGLLSTNLRLGGLTKV